MAWKSIEELDLKNPIWVLKYDMYSKDGEFCDKDTPGTVKHTYCHGWYSTEEAALKVWNNYQNRSAYSLEKVHHWVLKESNK